MWEHNSRGSCLCKGKVRGVSLGKQYSQGGLLRGGGAEKEKRYFGPLIRMQSIFTVTKGALGRGVVKSFGAVVREQKK